MCCSYESTVADGDVESWNMARANGDDAPTFAVTNVSFTARYQPARCAV